MKRDWVVNCSQIFCTFAVETTRDGELGCCHALWIALKFFVLLQSKQQYYHEEGLKIQLWIALKFFVLLQSKQLKNLSSSSIEVVNCSQIFCTFAVETTCDKWLLIEWTLWIALKFFVLLQSKQQLWWFFQEVASCELLSNFLYFCSRNNQPRALPENNSVVNCSQIFCTFAVETTAWAWSACARLLWIALKFFVLLQSKQPIRYNLCAKSSCELLSNFLYFCSRNN